jgi:2,3-bisphosphoglycerate-independent phosphoglycerate mutase
MARNSKKRLIVVSKHGRHRFQRGLVTASFLQQNLNIEEAMRLSALVKQEFEGREEVTTSELRKSITALISETGPVNVTPQSDPTLPMVRTRRGVLPFSKGVQLRALATAGLEIDEALRFSQQIEAWLRQHKETVFDAAIIDQKIIEELERNFSRSYSRRYMLGGWVRNTSKPVVLLIGGATGTGKSTLAMELASSLRIRKVTGTDMIRETIRTILSPDVAPGLHDHSFSAMGSTGDLLSNPRERVLVGFHQQAAQVGVGIRAVIRRAIRESSPIIIEGTHLVPPLSQYLPPGADVHFAGVMLSVHSKKAHKRRFPMRARKAPARSPVDYLDAYQAVRWIHDDLIELSDEYQDVVISNMNLEQTLIQSINYFSEALPVQTPHLPDESPTSAKAPPFPKTLFLILDGLADEPNPSLGNLTPLGAAKTPTLNRLAASGGMGLVNTSPAPGCTPNTDEGLVALLRPEARGMKIGRGLFEALGQGIPLPNGAVLFRGNLATIQDETTLVDRRAGRIRTGIASLLNDLSSVVLNDGIVGHIYPGHEHRVIVMLQGQGLSADVSDTDPGGSARIQHFKQAESTRNTTESHRTAKALNNLLRIARRHLSEHPINEVRRAQGLYMANCIITRGAASVDELQKLPPLREQVAVVSACSTALGIARALTYTPVTSSEMTGNLDTNIPAKFEAAGKFLLDHDMVAIHFKGTDIAAHDQRPLAKRDYIERVDEALGVFLQDRDELRIIVSADHGTSSQTGNHLIDPVPVLISKWNGLSDESVDFDEESASGGVLGLMEPEDLFNLIS